MAAFNHTEQMIKSVMESASWLCCNQLKWPLERDLMCWIVQLSPLPNIAFLVLRLYSPGENNKQPWQILKYMNSTVKKLQCLWFRVKKQPFGHIYSTDLNWFNSQFSSPTSNPCSSLRRKRRLQRIFSILSTTHNKILTEFSVTNWSSYI